MKNYTDSDYALNKFSKGIVYRFADGIVEVTLADYLAENPGMSECDFHALKKMSDDDYYERDRAENAQTRKNSALVKIDEIILCQEPSPEDLLISEIDEQDEIEKQVKRLRIADCALDKLTEVQRKRYLLSRVDGLTLREIAAIEGVGHTKIQKSIEAAEKKIKKHISGN